MPSAGVGTRPTRLLGRDAFLATARAASVPGSGVLLTGPTGIGKSAVLRVLAEEAAAAGARVLRCAPTAEDAGLPHAALSDLLRTVAEREYAQLRPYRRQALDAALLRGEPPRADRPHADQPRADQPRAEQPCPDQPCADRPCTGTDRFALRLAVADVLELLAAETRVLLVLDDLPHLDPGSADVLAHVAHRAADLGVTVLAARSGGAADGAAAPPRLHPPGAAELTVPPLTDSAIAALVADEIGEPDPDTLRRILHLAAGNPFQARELAKAAADAAHLAAPAGEPLLPESLSAPVRRRLDGLSARTRAALLVAAVADRPGLGLLRAAGLPDPASALAEAEQRGLAAVGADGRVRLSAPLVAAVIRAEAPARERIAVHAALSRTLAEPVERARHLALAHPYEDQHVAGVLAAAAATARRGGAADAAYELAVLAVDRTPADRSEDRHQRLLAVAAHAADAGRHQDARRAADRVLAETPDAVRRVHARLALLETAGQALDDTGSLIEGGLNDAAGEPGLQARLRFWSAVRELLGGRTAGAGVEAGRAVALAARADDRATQVDALGLLATVQSMRGRPAAAETALASAFRLDGASLADGAAASASLVRRRALVDLDADRVATARKRIEALAERTREAGAVEELLSTVVAQVRIQSRAGDCRNALATAQRGTRLLADAQLDSPLGHYIAALAESVGGSVPRAVRLARAAVDGCSADGDRLFQIRALGVLGAAHLLGGSAPGAAEAAEVLQHARELSAAMELADPDAVRRLADLAEALALLGEPAEAQRVLTEARTLAAEWPRGWAEGALAAVERSEGLALAAVGRTEEGVAVLRRSAARLRTVELPLDLVRTLAGWGSVERRARHRSVARAVLAEAEQLCRDHAAQPLLARVRQEQERLDPGERDGLAVDLTPSERRVADLVAGGATNREVAAALFVSVKTVEGTLSRVYRKLGVRSRTGLARAGTPADARFPLLS
ncbi:AAA family ATPase [Streptacidiphilus albus]|uniref:AAA family ATPase n=1 Tax=Streptacidiphilus albus TaxID=105425 RepID=UPI000689C1DA|nr:LuxR family transcriptional regulator [Streptacidiphilus albus]